MLLASVGLVALGCAEGGRGDVAAKELAVVAEGEAAPTGPIDCSGAAGPSLLSLAPLSDAVDEDVARGSTFELLATNASESSGTLTVTATSTSEAGDTRAEVATIEMLAGAAEEIGVDPEAAGLPGGTFEYSGSVFFDADLTLDDGSRDDARLSLSFHPVADGWRIYDEAARVANWNRGALSQEVRDRLPSILERVRPGAVLGSIAPVRIGVPGEERADGEEPAEAEGAR